jgi:hypothetical protein
MPAIQQPEEWVLAIRRLARAATPREVLCVGAKAREALADSGLRLCDGQPATLLAAPYDSTTSDLAVLVDVLEEMPRQQAAALIARLRDILARRLLVKLDLQCDRRQGWTRHDLWGMGLTEALRYQEGGRSIGIYHFNLYDYKLTPDWLNARYWAHPQLWKP